MNPELLEAFRTLLLPIDPDGEAAAVAALEACLDAQAILAEDQPAWLRLERDKWRESNEPGAVLADAVRAALTAGSVPFGTLVAAKFFPLHSMLQSRHDLPHDEASTFLSHLLLIARLAQQDKMSAAQITRMLAARDARLTFRWRTVRDALTRLEMRPKLVPKDVEALVALDLKSESLFADANTETAAEMVAEVAERLGFEGDLRSWLLALAGAGGQAPFAPYLQILHYQCIIANSYDHTPQNAYEFSPRGVIVTWLLKQYPAALIEAGNPFLNNAKAVQELDLAWAEGREDNLTEARALASILWHMQSMGFAARKELADWIRRWLHRVMAIHSGHVNLLPQATAAHMRAAMQAIGARPSNTRGVIEQRVIDALTFALHVGQEWRPRGLRDSVNATNLSTHKLGDADYQDSANHVVEAFEAHAGRLTSIYVEEHLRTLAKALIHRRHELEAITDLNDWTVRVVFVAHAFEGAAPPVQEISGARVEIVFKTFATLIAEATQAVAEPHLVVAFDTYVHEPLNERRTPDWIRAAYAVLAQGAP